MVCLRNMCVDTLHKGDNDDDDDDDILFAINHRNNTGTNVIVNCDIYWVAKLLQKGAKRKIYKPLIRTAMLYDVRAGLSQTLMKENVAYLKGRY